MKLTFLPPQPCGKWSIRYAKNVSLLPPPLISTLSSLLQSGLLTSTSWYLPWGIFTKLFSKNRILFSSKRVIFYRTITKKNLCMVKCLLLQNVFLLLLQTCIPGRERKMSHFHACLILIYWLPTHRSPPYTFLWRLNWKTFFAKEKKGAEIWFFFFPCISPETNYAPFSKEWKIS